MLEDTGKIRVTDLQTPERRMNFNVEQTYKALKETLFFDKERGLWNQFVNNGLVRPPILLGEEDETYSEDQFLALLIESKFNKNGAEKKLDELKETPLYRQKDDMWNIFLDKSGKDSDWWKDSSTQLIYILLTANLTGLDEARERLHRVKQSGLYSWRDNLWNYFWAGEVSEDIRLNDQLLGILVEVKLFDKSEAKKKWGALKLTPFYDPQRNQWNQSMDYEGTFCRNSDRTSENQLLAILVEAQFDKEKARVNLEKLEQTPLYDPGTDKWNYYMTGKQQVNDSIQFSRDQLLYLLVQQALEGSEIVENLLPSLPEQRSY